MDYSWLPAPRRVVIEDLHARLGGFGHQDLIDDLSARRVGTEQIDILVIPPEAAPDLASRRNGPREG